MENNNTKNTDIESILEKYDSFESIKSIPLNEIAISNRLLNAFAKNNINTIGDLINQEFKNLITIRNLGKKSINELKNIINIISNKYNLGIITLGDEFTKDEKIEQIRKFEETLNERIIDAQYSKTAIDECKLSMRLKKKIKRHKIYFLNEFIKTPIIEIKEYPYLGKKCFKEVIDLKIKIINQNIFSDDNSDYIFNVIQRLSEGESVSIIMLKILKYFNY